MHEWEPAKDDDMSSNELSIEDRWEGCTMQCINIVKKDAFRGHCVTSCTMYDGRQASRRYYRQEEYYQE
eukprot:1603737-Ditylum_brightwellii.AAC.1